MAILWMMLSMHLSERFKAALALPDDFRRVPGQVHHGTHLQAACAAVQHQFDMVLRRARISSASFRGSSSPGNIKVELNKGSFNSASNA